MVSKTEFLKNFPFSDRFAGLRPDEHRLAYCKSVCGESYPHTLYSCLSSFLNELNSVEVFAKNIQNVLSLQSVSKRVHEASLTNISLDRHLRICTSLQPSISKLLLEHRPLNFHFNEIFTRDEFNLLKETVPRQNYYTVSSIPR